MLVAVLRLFAAAIIRSGGGQGRGGNVGHDHEREG